MKCHVCGDSSRLEPVTCVRRCETTHVTARPSRSRSPDSPTGRPDLTPPADLPGLPSFSVSDGRGPADTRPMRPEFTPTPHRRPPLRGGLSPDTARLAGAVQLPSGYLLPAGTFTLSSLSFWSRDVGLHTLWLPGRRRAPSRSRDPGRGGSAQTTRVRSVLCVVSLRPSLRLAVQAAPNLALSARRARRLCPGLRSPLGGSRGVSPAYCTCVWSSSSQSRVPVLPVSRPLEPSPTPPVLSPGTQAAVPPFLTGRLARGASRGLGTRPCCLDAVGPVDTPPLLGLRGG